jgi:prepilin signal peptidase PulO-like enzyme (type II secretory pathway)
MAGMIVVYSIFIVFSLGIAVQDYRTGFLPRPLLWCAGFFFLGIQLLMDKNSLLLPVCGCLLGLGIFLLAFLVSGKKLGLADVWYAGIIGIVTGPLWWYPVIIISCMTAIIYGVCAKKRRFPFIPFMAAGVLIVLPVRFLVVYRGA